MTLVVIRLERTVTVLIAAAASVVGVDALLAVLGVTAAFPVAFPMVILGLALLAGLHLAMSRVRRQWRGRRPGRPRG